MDMFSRFWPSSTESDLVFYLSGVQTRALLFRNGYCLAQLTLTETQPDAVESPLRQWLQQNQCKRPAIHLLLAESCYQQTQLEKPRVPEAEVRGALPWLVKDLIALPPENMQLDYYDLPGPGATQRVAVVATEKAWLQSWIQLFDRVCKGQVCNVQIEELAMLELFASEEVANLLLWQRPGQDAQLLLIHQGSLILSRSLRGTSTLSTLTGELLAGLVDTISLEVQRAMDYFESNLRQPPVRKIQLLVQSEQLGLIRDLMATNLSADVVLFTPPQAERSDLPDPVLNLSILGALLHGQVTA